jgi:hypothetical protein
MFDSRFDWIVVGVCLSAIAGWLGFLVWLVNLMFDYV